ncbi:putative Bacterial regulatory s, tetR family protein [Candidatus Desulfosporosinus infrequens]|uniref:Putative Bacterial regulatory s, tetR family protein n=1 Tax=Candidatus Desulfosporosinus infrequens TaxID=2043169 RepID=A0A2U3KDV3_9FIRM|nr:putative Bacterial regulatory s, tetR family protein [Candidatus Desulfosporosinus infrequens]
MPSEQFLNLPSEKQTNILNSCLEEFASYGFETASTNRIVNRAGISKGVLFKYFKDKESLFLYVCEMVLKQVVELFSINNMERFDDLFSFLKYITLQKIMVYKKHPEMYRLFLRIIRNPEHPIYSKIARTTTMITNDYMANVVRVWSSDGLNPDVSKERAISAILWILEGIQNKYLLSAPDATDNDQFDVFCQQLLLEIDQYFELLKYGMYSRKHEN